MTPETKRRKNQKKKQKQKQKKASTKVKHVQEPDQYDIEEIQSHDQILSSDVKESASETLLHESGNNQSPPGLKNLTEQLVTKENLFKQTYDDFAKVDDQKPPETVEDSVVDQTGSVTSREAYKFSTENDVVVENSSCIPHQDERTVQESVLILNDGFEKLGNSQGLFDHSDDDELLPYRVTSNSIKSGDCSDESLNKTTTSLENAVGESISREKHLSYDGGFPSSSASKISCNSDDVTLHPIDPTSSTNNESDINKGLCIENTDQFITFEKDEIQKIASPEQLITDSESFKQETYSIPTDSNDKLFDFNNINEMMPWDEVENNIDTVNNLVTSIQVPEPSNMKFSFLDDDDDLLDENELDDDDSFLDSGEESLHVIDQTGTVLAQQSRTHDISNSTGVHQNLFESHLQAKTVHEPEQESKNFDQAGKLPIDAPSVDVAPNILGDKYTPITISQPNTMYSQSQLQPVDWHTVKKTDIYKELGEKKQKSDAYDFPMSMVKPTKLHHSKPVNISSFQRNPSSKNVISVNSKPVFHNSYMEQPISALPSNDINHSLGITSSNQLQQTTPQLMHSFETQSQKNPYAPTQLTKNHKSELDIHNKPQGMTLPPVKANRTTPYSPKTLDESSQSANQFTFPGNNNSLQSRNISVLPPTTRSRTFSSGSVGSNRSSSAPLNPYAPIQSQVNNQPGREYSPGKISTSSLPINKIPVPYNVNVNIGNQPIIGQSNQKRTHARSNSSVYAPAYASKYAPTVQPQYQQHNLVSHQEHINMSSWNFPSQHSMTQKDLHMQGLTIIHEPKVDGELLNHRQFPIFHWGTSSNIIYALPSKLHPNSFISQLNNTVESINICNSDTILKVPTYLKDFPGPLQKGKTKKKDLERWFDSAISSFVMPQHSDISILCSLLKSSLIQNLSRKEISKVLYDSDELLPYLSQPYISSKHSPNAFKLDANEQLRILAYLQVGDHDNALQLALTHKDYAMALLMGSILGKEKWSVITEKYLHDEFQLSGSSHISNNLLVLIFQVFLGNSKGIIQEFTADHSKSIWALQNWNMILAVILNNVTHLASGSSLPPVIMDFFLDFGVFLIKNNRSIAGAITFILTNLPFSSKEVIPNSGVKFECIGDANSLESILLSEVYEFTYISEFQNSKFNDFPCLISQKATHAAVLAEYNLTSLSSKYAESVSSMLRCLPKNSSTTLTLTSRLDLINSKLSGSASGWLNKPSLSSVWGQLDKSFNKFIGGDDESDPAPEKKMFDNFTPGSSRNASVINLQQQNFTPVSIKMMTPSLQRNPPDPAGASKINVCGPFVQDIRSMNASKTLYSSSIDLPISNTVTSHIPSHQDLTQPSSLALSSHTFQKQQHTNHGYTHSRTTSNVSTGDFSSNSNPSLASTPPPLFSGLVKPSKSKTLINNKLASVDQLYSTVLTAPPSSVSKNKSKGVIQSPKTLFTNHGSDSLTDMFSPPVHSIPTTKSRRNSLKSVESYISLTGRSRKPKNSYTSDVIHLPNTYKSNNDLLELKKSSSCHMLVGDKLSLGSPVLNHIDEQDAGVLCVHDTQLRENNLDDSNFNTLLDNSVTNSSTDNEDICTTNSLSTHQEMRPFQHNELGVINDIQHSQIEVNNSSGNKQSSKCLYLPDKDGRFDQPLSFNKNSDISDQTILNEPVMSKLSGDHVEVPYDSTLNPSGTLITDTYVHPSDDQPKNEHEINKTACTLVSQSSKKSLNTNIYTPKIPCDNNFYDNPSDVHDSVNMFTYGGYNISNNDFMDVDSVSKNAETVTYTENNTSMQEITRDSFDSSKFKPADESESDHYDDSTEVGIPIIKPSSNPSFTPFISPNEEMFYDDVVDESDDDDDERKKLERQKKENDKSNSKTQGKGSGWFSWLKKNSDDKKPIKAKLGNKNNFYYDEQLKRWINKDASEQDKQKVSSVPPPPPIVKRKPTDAGETKPRTGSIAGGPSIRTLHATTSVNTLASVQLSSVSSSKDDVSVISPLSSTLPLPQTKTNVNLAGKTANGLDDLISLTGSSTSIGSSRRKKKTTRGYVNVMNNL